MYCAACDRWEDDQIALDCEVCTRCMGNLCSPDDYEEDDEPTGVRTVDTGDELHQILGEALNQSAEKPSPTMKKVHHER